MLNAGRSFHPRRSKTIADIAEGIVKVNFGELRLGGNDVFFQWSEKKQFDFFQGLQTQHDFKALSLEERRQRVSQVLLYDRYCVVKASLERGIADYVYRTAHKQVCKGSEMSSLEVIATDKTALLKKLQTFFRGQKPPLSALALGDNESSIDPTFRRHYKKAMADLSKKDPLRWERILFLCVNVHLLFALADHSLTTDALLRTLEDAKLPLPETTDQKTFREWLRRTFKDLRDCKPGL
jgi:hypothetical protein